MSSSSTKSVVVAVSANLIVTVAKFVGFAISGSGAMLAEAVHSVADTANQALLFLGLKRSLAPPDTEHPYGYGRERFFWGLVSALGIFFLGAGITGYHGVTSLMQLEPAHYTASTWTILALAFLLEGTALSFAWRGTRKDARARELTTWQYVREGRDPTALAVILEDGAAVTGVILASAGMGLSAATGWPGWDAIATIAISLLLAGAAVLLIRANREYLLGRGIDPKVARRVRGVIARDSAVLGVEKLQGIVQTVDHYRIAADIEFDGAAIAKGVLAGANLEAVAESLDGAEAVREYLEGFARRVIERLGDEVDELEAKIKDQVPDVKDIDLETN